MNKRAYGKFQSAFTLVELLIVIVVIAILASITVIAYSNIKDRATDSVMASTAKSLQKGIQMKHAFDGSILLDSTPGSRVDILSGYNVSELGDKVDIVYFDTSSTCVTQLSDVCSPDEIDKSKVVLVMEYDVLSVGTIHWSSQDNEFINWRVSGSGEVQNDRVPECDFIPSSPGCGSGGNNGEIPQ